MLLPLTNTQRVERFGRFRFEPAPRASSPEAIRILDNWAATSIVPVFCPQLAKLFGIGSVRLHRLAAEPFLDLWAAWQAERLLDRVTSWNGAWVPRFKRGKAGGGEAALSNHSWGTAFDVCAREYPLGRAVPADAPIRALVPAANRIGWYWGGDFSNPDGMHFEFVGLPPALDAREAARRLLQDGLTLGERRAAQAALGLEPDGVIGPKTLARARAVLGEHG